jgi:GcrA cell cycle regulator
MPGDSGNRCSLFELQQWHCRWPIGDPTAEDFGFCGNKPVDGLPYCPVHARGAYRPGTRTREHAVRELHCLASRVG